MQQSFVLKETVAAALEDAATILDLKAAQLIGYFVSVGLLCVEAVNLTPHVQESIENAVAKFEFANPTLRGRNPVQDEMPF